MISFLACSRFLYFWLLHLGYFGTHRKAEQITHWVILVFQVLYCTWDVSVFSTARDQREQSQRGDKEILMHLQPVIRIFIWTPDHLKVYNSILFIFQKSVNLKWFLSSSPPVPVLKQRIVNSKTIAIQTFCMCRCRWDVFQGTNLLYLSVILDFPDPN